MSGKMRPRLYSGALYTLPLGRRHRKDRSHIVYRVVLQYIVLAMKIMTLVRDRDRLRDCNSHLRLPNQQISDRPSG